MKEGQPRTEEKQQVKQIYLVVVDLRVPSDDDPLLDAGLRDASFDGLQRNITHEHQPQEDHHKPPPQSCCLAPR